jgi:hypothetical protein
VCVPELNKTPLFELKKIVFPSQGSLFSVTHRLLFNGLREAT